MGPHQEKRRDLSCCGQKQRPSGPGSAKKREWRERRHLGFSHGAKDRKRFSRTNKLRRRAISADTPRSPIAMSLMLAQGPMAPRRETGKVAVFPIRTCSRTLCSGPRCPGRPWRLFSRGCLSNRVSLHESRETCHGPTVRRHNGQIERLARHGSQHRCVGCDGGRSFHARRAGRDVVRRRWSQKTRRHPGLDRHESGGRFYLFARQRCGITGAKRQQHAQFTLRHRHPHRPGRQHQPVFRAGQQCDQQTCCQFSPRWCWTRLRRPGKAWGRIPAP